MAFVSSIATFLVVFQPDAIGNIFHRSLRGLFLRRFEKQHRPIFSLNCTTRTIATAATNTPSDNNSQ